MIRKFKQVVEIGLLLFVDEVAFSRQILVFCNSIIVATEE